MERRILDTERDRKRLNIVVSGLQFETQKEGFDELQRVIEEIAGKTVRVKGIRTHYTARGKIITAACESWEDKMLIMRAKKNLFNMKEQGKQQIYIDSDLPADDRRAQAIVRQTAKELRKQGKEVQVQFLRLKVDGELMHLNGNTQELEKRTFREKDKNDILERTRTAQEGQRHK